MSNVFPLPETGNRRHDHSELHRTLRLVVMAGNGLALLAEIDQNHSDYLTLHRQAMECWEYALKKLREVV